MAEDLLSQCAVRRVIGQSRLRRLCAAGWLKPVGRTAYSVLFAPRDIHLALSRAERERCPPNKLEVQRVRLSEKLNGHPYVKKGRSQRPGVDEIAVDFSGFSNCT